MVRIAAVSPLANPAKLAVGYGLPATNGDYLISYASGELDVTPALLTRSSLPDQSTTNSVVLVIAGSESTWLLGSPASIVLSASRAALVPAAGS